MHGNVRSPLMTMKDVVLVFLLRLHTVTVVLPCVMIKPVMEYISKNDSNYNIDAVCSNSFATTSISTECSVSENDLN